MTRRLKFKIPMKVVPRQRTLKKANKNIRPTFKRVAFLIKNKLLTKRLSYRSFPGLTILNILMISNRQNWRV